MMSTTLVPISSAPPQPPSKARDARVATLAAAFYEDPGFTWIFPDADKRLAQLLATYTCPVAHAQRHGGVVSLDDGCAVGVWMPSTRAVIGFRDARNLDTLLLPFKVGLSAMGRLNAAERDGEEIVHSHVTGTYAYLMALAVHPDRQGKGLSREVVSEVEHQARGAGFATLVLRTEQPRNVSLYQHLGFELHGTRAARTSGLDVSVFSKPL
jgi:ribosomal protein S18 acetylase RimI-like enzyme